MPGTPAVTNPFPPFPGALAEILDRAYRGSIETGTLADALADEETP
jgi:hypothetical protein